MRRKLFFVALLLLPVAAPAADQGRFRSRHYQITTDLDKGLVMKFAEHMDLVFGEYVSRFRGFPAKNQGGQPLYVFARQKDYLDFLGKHGIDGTGSGGMFFVNAKGSGLATFLEGQGVEQMLYTLRHEGFHQFAFNRIGSDLPLWVNEGLAEYFASSIVVAKSLRTGQVPVGRLNYLRSAVETDRHIPFEELLTMTGNQWGERVRGGDGAMQYAQSWSVVHFLVRGGKDYQLAFEAYLKQVARGVSSEEAFGKAFGSGSYQVFEKKWREYLTTLEPNAEATVAQRLEFLGRGAGWLLEHGEKVESFDGLKSALQSREFTTTYGSGHGSTFQMKALDEENFQAPPAEKKGVESAIELVPTQDPKLPPGFVVKGLKVPVKLVWEVGADGKPFSRIVYE